MTICRILASLAVAVVLGLSVACEDNGGGGGGGGKKHDFGSNDSNVVVCIGDSITQGQCAPDGAPYPAQLAGLTGKHVVNAGICGEESNHAAGRAGSLLRRHKPGYMCILTGSNDASEGRPVGSVANNIRSIVRACKNNKTVAVLATLPPMVRGHSVYNGNVNDYNAQIRLIAAEEDCDLVDINDEFGGNSSLLQADGLHPTAAGTQIIAISFSARTR